MLTILSSPKTPTNTGVLDRRPSISVSTVDPSRIQLPDLIFPPPPPPPVPMAIEEEDPEVRRMVAEQYTTPALILHGIVSPEEVRELFAM